MRVSGATLALGVAAAASVGLVQLDPWLEAGPEVTWVSTRSAARKLLPQSPGLAEAVRAVTLAPVGESRVRIVAEGDRYGVWVDDELLGPADPEAVDGLLASLRIATTLRAVAEGAALEATWRGSILIDSPPTTLEIRVGGDTADGVGVYGALPHEGDQVWVIEREVALLLEQEAEAWVLGRLLPLVASEVEGLRWDDWALARGEDGIWREIDGVSPALLANDVIDSRIDRLLGATFDPLLARDMVDRNDLQPWLRVQTRSGESTVALGGACPGREDARVAARGPGALGCLSVEVLGSWPVAEAVEPRLLPHAYERVLAVSQQRPDARSLRRDGPGWAVHEGETSVAVAEPEVYRYYAALHEARVERATEAAERWQVHSEILVQTDSTQALKLACSAGALLCRRDNGPLLRPVDPHAIELGFTAGTFARRRLVDLAAGDARAIEILPAEEGARQSVRLDLGSWTVDAPVGKDLDSEKLHTMLAAVMSARAKDWVDVPEAAPLRTLRIERTPRGGRSTLVIALYADCVARVEGHERGAALSRETCEALSADLVANAP
jgi:hypothetical protein